MTRAGWVVTTALLMVVSLAAPAAGTGPDDGVSQVPDDLRAAFEEERRDPDADLAARDLAAEAVLISEGPFAKVTKNLALRGRGERLVGQATTDVWAHEGFAYTGTFNSPCGGEEGAGVWVWDVHNPNKPSFVTVIPSPVGSRSNDVKVATLNSGTILGHSNEACAEGGPGGIELYDVDDPRRPVHLASIRADELNPVVEEFLGPIVDVGVHNLFLFSQGSRDYVAINAESAFHNFRIFDITDPTNPSFVSAWGAEEILDPGVGAEEEDPERVLDALIWLFSGFGTSRNRFLHDMTVTADGTLAYLSNWDAGLVLLDISDPADPQLVSVALDPENGSRDGEVNSHAAWPSEDGTIVVETEEDFDTPFSTPGITFTDQPTNTIPGVATSTVTGDDFEAHQTGNVVTVTPTDIIVESGPLEGNVYPAREGVGNQPRLEDLGGSITGEAVWIGRACDGDEILNAEALAAAETGIAVARRGACFFWEKLKNAAAAGAEAIIIANNDRSVWGGVRVWDYSNPADPVLASTFDTVCSANAEHPSCDPRGTYSVHNVIVETTGNRVKAYLSWYWDGMLVLDVTDPAHPVEVARFFDDSPEFVEANGGNPHDFWGVYKEPRAPWIYGSDRNGGLYVFKEQGSGSGK